MKAARCGEGQASDSGPEKNEIYERGGKRGIRAIEQNE